MLFPLAVDRLADLEAGQRRGRIPDAVDAHLRGFFSVCGFFDVLPAGQNPRGAALEGATRTTIDFQSWHSSGAWAFVKGTLSRDSRKRPVLTLQLFVAEEARARLMPHDRQVLKDLDPKTIKRAVALWVDDVVTAFTGKGGVFSTRIAFAHRDSKMTPKEVYVMDVDGGNRSAITQNGSINMLPAWTPNGQVAYTSFQDHNPDLFVGKRKLSRYPRMNSGVAFHPDGKRMALTLSKDGNAEIYISNAKSGKTIRRVTVNRAIDTSPTWSPDGKRLAFLSDRATGLPQIFTIDLTSSEPPRRPPQVGGYNSSPDWSPTGDEIAYSAQVGGERYQIFVIDLKAGVVRRLTSQGSNEEPSWSPDGRYIVYSSRRSGRQGLWVMSADGRFTHQISSGPGIFSTPAWERPTRR
ncbi:MAG: tol-pal system beta propeller repeat protein TolB [Myxococcota bacterium]